MNNYHLIHCSKCGGVMDATQIIFSMKDFAESAYRLGDTFNNEALGNYLDEDAVGRIMQEEYLWDFSVLDLENAYTRDGVFELKGKTILKRFGPRVLELFSQASEDEIGDAQSEVMTELLPEIFKKIPNEKIIRMGLTGENVRQDIINLLLYAKSEATLLRTHLVVNIAKDDCGRDIPLNISDENNQIICRTKRCCYCAAPLSNMAGKYEEKIVCFLGSPAAGKSAYLAAAISKLQEIQSSEELDLKIQIDSESMDYKYFERECLEPYRFGFGPTKTAAGTFPQVSVGIGYENKNYLYTFVDIPGETLIEETDDGYADFDAANAKSNRKIMIYADVVWFCAASEQLFSEHIYETEALDAREIEILNTALDDLLALGERTKIFADVMFADQKRPAVGFLLTKSDKLSSYLSDGLIDSSGNMKTELSPEEKKIVDMYFNFICAPPRGCMNVNKADGDQSDMIREGCFSYELFQERTRKIEEALLELGRYEDHNDVRKLFDSLKDAFDSSGDLVCFSTAPYGRNAEAFNLFRVLSDICADAEQKKKVVRIIAQTDGEQLLDDYLEARTTSLSKKLKTKQLQRIQSIYLMKNPVCPFGNMVPLMWMLAYTGLLPCCEYDENEQRMVRITEIEDCEDKIREKLLLKGDSAPLRESAPAKQIKKRFSLFGLKR